jgi:cell division septation protein DedD
MNSRASFDERKSLSLDERKSLNRVTGVRVPAPVDQGLRNQGPGNQGSGEDAVEDSKEITLSATGIGILLLLLAVICGGFFLYGYTVGHNSAEVANGTSSGSIDPGFGSFKPPPGSPKMQPIAGYDANGNPNGTDRASSAANAEAAAAASVKSTVEYASVPAKKTIDSTVAESDAVPETIDTAGAVPNKVRQPISLGPTAVSAATVQSPLTRTAVTLNATAPAAPAGPAIVQVAAVSHPEDADLLLSALSKRGYNAVSATSPGDKLIHVQLGPFNNRQDAVAIQKRLLADGFNAIVR